MKKLHDLIALCVINNTVFYGALSNTYTVQDLVNTVSLETISSMYGKVEDKLSKLGKKSLIKRDTDEKRNSLEFQSEVLKEVYEYKEDQSKALLRARKQSKIKKENDIKKLMMLKSAEDREELKRIENLTPEERQKEIDAIEKA